MDEIIKEKIVKFTTLMEELSEDFAMIFKEGREDEYLDEAKLMLESLDRAQKIVNKIKCG